MTSPEEVQVAEVRDLGPFTFRWPDQVEEFEFGWEFDVRINGETYRVRHGVGGRTVYGRERIHTVTWLDGQRPPCRLEVASLTATEYAHAI